MSIDFHLVPGISWPRTSHDTVPGGTRDQLQVQAAAVGPAAHWAAAALGLDSGSSEERRGKIWLEGSFVVMGSHNIP